MVGNHHFHPFLNGWKWDSRYLGGGFRRKIIDSKCLWPPPRILVRNEGFDSRIPGFPILKMVHVILVVFLESWVGEGGRSRGPGGSQEGILHSCAFVKFLPSKADSTSTKPAPSRRSHRPAPSLFTGVSSTKIGIKMPKNEISSKIRTFTDTNIATFQIHL